MLQTAKIRIRDIKELQDNNIVLTENQLLAKTPLRKRKNLRSATTSKKLNGNKKIDNKNHISVNKTVTRTTVKKIFKYEQPSSQKRIDFYFTSCPKTYEIKDEPRITFGKNNEQMSGNRTKNSCNDTKAEKRTPTRRPKIKRKCLFGNSGTEDSNMSDSITLKKNGESPNKKQVLECITINSDSEDDGREQDLNTGGKANNSMSSHNTKSAKNQSQKRQVLDKSVACLSYIDKQSCTTTSNKSSSSSTFCKRTSKISCEKSNTSTEIISSATKISKRKVKPCPSYKIIEGTTFAVDAFQFGYIKNVTHYFLTHFHADHYIGLTKSFAMPIYMSPITARFLRVFIPVEEQYIHELELNQTYKINDIEVTALDANHCPGAILLVFKFCNTGKCILHTGDFRAWHGMESEPIFWNNDIHTIYLDTTYISDKYAFCTQYESLLKAYNLIDKFNDKYADKRILYVCGTYVIGKEKFWSKLAEVYNLKVWAEGNRYKALKAINDEEINNLLVEDPNEANMHVIAMGKLSYLHLIDYFKPFEYKYDVIFAIRPSGWEKDTKPQYRGKINIVGVEYSEHSSYDEMKRFVKFLKPQLVFSTVPTGRDPMKTAEVPLNWYKYDKLKSSSNYQPSITTYLGQTPQNKAIRAIPNIDMDDAQNLVSPLKPQKEITNNLEEDRVFSIYSSKTTDSKDNQQMSLNKNSRSKVKPADQTLDNNKCSTFISKTSNNSKISKSLTESSSGEFETADVTVMRKRPQRVKKLLQGKGVATEILATENDQLITRKMQVEDNKVINKTPICSKFDKKSTRINKVNTTSEQVTEDLETATKRIQQKAPPIERNNKKLAKIEQVYTSEEEFENCIETLNLRVKTRAATKLDFSYEEKYKDWAKNLNPTTLRNTKAVEKMTKDQGSITNSSLSSKNMTGKEYKIDLEKSEKFASLFSTSTDSISQSSNNLQYARGTINKKSTKNTIEMSSEDNTEEMENKTVTFDRKRNELSIRNKSGQDLKSISQCLTNLKPHNQSLHTKSILQTILENNEDFDQYSRRQLAGVVVETLNEQNHDESKDHIPIDLLSDTDDINVSGNLKSNSSSEHPPNFLNARKRQSLRSISNNLMPLKKSKQPLDTKNDLKTIIKNNEDLDKYSCSKLAGHMMETINEQNSGHSKDHTPVDSLSDADDDWM